MDELENVHSLLAYLKAQSYKNLKIICCVNQPEQWWDDPDKKSVCESNLKTLSVLQNEKGLDILTIDRCSPGKGWDNKHFGVGWARKLSMDKASDLADEHDIIVTMDGDSEYGENYLSTIIESLGEFPDIKAISVPYYHRLTGNKAEDLAVLRYEIYMRYYALNMLRIENPYAFTALGSAIACGVNTYRSIRGMTPHKSGEDFYFIQKIRKFGPVMIHLDETVFPAARFSDRVFFGTGPAMIKGDSGDWSGYPVFPFTFFDEVKESFDGFQNLYENDILLPMSEFLFEKFGNDFWQALRENVKTKSNFIRSCQHKVDGLRILQFLKWRHQQNPGKDEENMAVFFKAFYPNENICKMFQSKTFTFSTASVDQLEMIRNFLSEEESLWRKKIRILQ